MNLDEMLRLQGMERCFKQVGKLRGSAGRESGYAVAKC